MVMKMCDVLIKSHDWRSVVNEKERKGQKGKRMGCAYPEEAEVRRNNMRGDISSWGSLITNADLSAKGALLYRALFISPA
jgi:hypothetical protein